MNHRSLSSFIWFVADLLRGDYKETTRLDALISAAITGKMDVRGLVQTQEAA
jgi:hypothetical protein